VPGIAQPNVVDLVGEDASGVVLMVMVEDREWGAEPEQAAQLKAKVNAYLGFIVDGSLVRHYPETEGKPVAICLQCVEAPHGEFAEIVEYTSVALQRWNIGFQLKLRPIA
jgi:hypothetical protein